MTRPLPKDAHHIFDAPHIARGIQNLAQGLYQRWNERGLLPDVALVGIHGGGGILVQRVNQALETLADPLALNLNQGMLDISQYRDDYTRLTQMPSVRSSVVPFDVEDRHIILIDDVIFTGRTTRAALEALFSLGRPASVELAVLVDRGHREFPIQPDVTGLTLETDRHQSVNVFLFEDPTQDYATLEDNKYSL